MSVILETSLGDITIDLLVSDAPKCCENFLKLCKSKYYNFSPVHIVQPNFSFQTGDPIGPGSKDSDGGSSVWGLVHGVSRRTFKPEFQQRLKHNERGTVSMATVPSSQDPEQREAASQFLITLGDNIDYLNDRAAIFGKVAEGFDTLEAINTAFIDERGRPLRDIRILHTIVVDEEDIPDPTGLIIPPESPPPSAAQRATERIAWNETVAEDADPEAVAKLRRERDARAQALTLEMVGDLPFAEVAPPENVLFVCKLNPVTRDDDLELIFGKYGDIMSCEVIRDKKTAESLQYAFIEYAKREECEQAYFKMQDVLIDDHRIHVDFSQSVSKLADPWRTKRTPTSGGFGGIQSLEKKRQYRAQEETRRDDRRYGMVFNKRDGGRRREESDTRRDRSRSRSPRRERQREGNRRR